MVEGRSEAYVIGETVESQSIINARFWFASLEQKACPGPLKACQTGSRAVELQLQASSLIAHLGERLGFW